MPLNITNFQIQIALNNILGTKLVVDGQIGPKTKAALLQYAINKKMVGFNYDAIVASLAKDYLAKVELQRNINNPSSFVSQDGIKLILEYEVGGSDGSYYNKFLKSPTVPAWETTQSGVTIGIGFDLGHNTKEALYKEWSEFIDIASLQKLEKVLGLKGKDAYNKLNLLKDIRISWEDAKEHFIKYTLPRYSKLALSTFPGLDNAPQAIRDVIVSLVFNRGNSLIGDSRLEMRNIKSAIINQKWLEIPKQIRAMKRLWPNVSGLLKRREDEASFISNKI